ncbi:MAG: peptide chain release factor 1 [Planctomycetota bacterium]|nr:peptide chain release factor 1 [Planctomycetota bacterium]
MTEYLRPKIAAKLDGMSARLAELLAKASQPDLLSGDETFATIQKEMGSLQRTVSRYEEFRNVVQQLEGNNSLLAPGGDPELAEMAREELPELDSRARQLVSEIIDGLISEASQGDRNAIVEIRAGTGGDEAALFVRDLMLMYAHFAERQGWRVEQLDESPSEVGGFKEVILNISGADVFKFMRFESGGHRVQRVPATESQGRIHTSAATVAVLAEAEDVEVHISESDLRIDTYRASGAGGQHVNKTDSAVRITHEPTGAVVQCQSERSQHKNKSKAMKALKTKLLDLQREKVEGDRSQMRKDMVGSGDRSARIRTYNYPQNRITDHRIGKNFSLEQVVEGRLEPVFEALLAADREQRIEDL